MSLHSDVNVLHLPFFCAVLLLFCVLPLEGPQAREKELEPLRLYYNSDMDGGQACDLHPGSSGPQAGGAKKPSGRPLQTFESEHRPVAQRTYYIGTSRRRAAVNAYVRRPNGEVTEPKLQFGYKANVSFATPLGDGPVHGPNSVYVVEQGVEENILTIRTAKWITMHHNCSWGHGGKFDESLTRPQPFDIIPFEVLVDRLWDTNFHLGVSSGDLLSVTVLSYGKPVAGATVRITSEKGWSKAVVCDSDGRAEIQMIRDYYPPVWKSFKRSHRGEFLISAFHDSLRLGSFRGEDYEGVRYITTLPWQYTPSTVDYTSYSHGLLVVLLATTISSLGVYAYRERRRKPHKTIHFDE